MLPSPLLPLLLLLPWPGLGTWPVPTGLVALVPALLVPVALGRRLGGHSGDSYGACVEWTESLGLLFIAGALRLAAAAG
ncbi:adenosylcobinamide-GDP ribazoletransferase [Synechococcus sp. BA-132 BA5]|uniref:adenosylcobinamide-GDP ribazoletransferase n=1 Tax=Synechococcus sp. BA-132 BA5 TaxID=3110252 RepID=UPI002B1E943F|nr:adenosylcobinamide-GDP ribazoletransferase [Synechococcus sp. BA-132 BA5]MEA5414179.1 adenosylcobinamide-GDP ribazoletransferase [Synechococcus sp. BA-132 BA5]